MANKEVIEKWVAALESGDYPQTQGALNTTDDDGNHSYCCLGVLCELAADEGLIEPADHYGAYAYTEYGVEYMEGGVLPPPVRGWAGLRYSNPDVAVNDERRSLTALNDRDMLTFPVIADIIRSNFLVDSDA